MRKSLSLLVLALGIGAANAQGAAAAKTLTVGDKAPELKVQKFVKGNQFSSFEAGKTYVVEFWATWCGPCKESIPHISELAKARPEVTFVGVSVWENQDPADTAYYATVEKFVKDWDQKMTYNVAMDDPKGWMANNWLLPAGQNGIPSTFIVHDQKVAWIGHPMMGLDKALDEIKSGSFDFGKAKAAHQKELDDAKVAAERQATLRPYMERIQKLAAADDFKGVVGVLDEAIGKHPEFESMLASNKFMFLGMYDEPAATAYAVKLSEGLFKDDAMELNSLAWAMIGDDSDWKKPDLAVAESIGKQAATVSKFEDAAILDTYALALFKNGKKAEAVEQQTKAVKLAKDQKLDPELVKELEGRLETFKKG